MIREVNLVSYLPDFMQAYQEPVAALTAENPEFQIIWEATDRVLYNRFISTADEYGISRFEKLLGILPSTEDTMESRRARVQNRWMDALPYTFRRLLQKLQFLCEDTDFTFSHNFEEGYTLEIETNLEQFGKVEELEHIIHTFLPCNIFVISNNAIRINAGEQLYFAGIVEFSQIITLSN